MSKRRIIIQNKFTTEEAAVVRARNPKAILCDAQNFCFINFADAEIVAGNEAKETTYLVSKAKGENPKPLPKEKATKA